MHICIADIVLSTYITKILSNHNDKVKLKQDLAIFYVPKGENTLVGERVTDSLS